MTNRKHFGLAVVAAVAGLAAPAYATESGAYLGISVGQSTYDVGDGENAFDITVSQSIDDSDTGFALAFGYRFNPYIGLEGSYVDFGEATLSETGRLFGFAPTFTADASISVSGPVVAAVVAVPVGNFEFGGKLGVFFCNTDIDGRVTGGGINESVSESASTTETLISFGAGFTIADNFHLRADYAMVKDAGDEEETGEGDVEMLTVGFQYRF